MVISKEKFPGEEMGPSDLSSLKNNLLLPLQKDFRVNMADIKIERVFPGTKKHEIASDIVNYSYNSMYGADGKIIDIARDNLNKLYTTITLVATQQFDHRSAVLGSLRFTYGNNLDVFKLFEMENGKSWPHEQSNSKKKPGEVGKFSFNPVLSESDLRYSSEERANFRRVLARDLYENGMRQLQKAGVGVPYVIFSKHVSRFAESIGVSPCLKVEGAKLKGSEDAREIKKIFSRYWNPDKDIKYQPALYVPPWDLQPARI
jgi:hypothetical protein